MSRLPRRTYRLGRRIGRAWARRPDAAERLTTGTRILARRAATGAADWVRDGRRHDLTGWRAALGPIARIAVLALGLWVLWRVLRAVPVLLWLATPAWLWGAWRAGKPTPPASAEPADEAPDEPDEEPSAEDPEPAPPDPRTTVLLWLADTIGNRPGIHLGELHSKLTDRPALAHLKRADIRTLLDRYGIAVERTLRVGRIAGRSGVSRTTVQGLLAALPQRPESGLENSPLSGCDLRKSSGSPPNSPSGEGREEDYFADVVQLFG